MSAFDRAAIMREAHATARRVAKSGEYRAAFAWALRNAWRTAKKLAGFRAVWAAQSPAERQRSDAAMAIEAKDRLSHSDRRQLAELRAA
jgi:hypothetical protein